MDKKVKKMYDENGNATHKVCSKCGELKSIDEFSVKKDASDGHESKCKECRKKYDEERKKQPKRNVAHKVCSKCGKLKSIDEFHANKSTSDGHESKCKECKKKYDKERKKRTKECSKKRHRELCEEIIVQNKFKNILDLSYKI
jgi:hypothetical protein